MPAPESIQRGRPRVEWFNDPVLLGQRIKELVSRGPEHDDYVFNLIARHRGSSDSVVYSELVAALNERGDQESLRMAIRYFKAVSAFLFVTNRSETGKLIAGAAQMRKRMLTPTPQAFTSVLNSYAILARLVNRSDATALTEILQGSSEVWAAIEENKRNLYHVNTALSICLAAHEYGGWEAGIALLKEIITPRNQRGALKEDAILVDSSPHMREVDEASFGDGTLLYSLPTDHRIRPDVWTFTVALRLCATPGREREKFDAAVDLWNNGVRDPRFRIAIDTRLVCGLLACHVAVDSAERAAAGVGIVANVFGLPSSAAPNRTHIGPKSGGAIVDAMDPPLPLSAVALDWSLKVTRKVDDARLGLLYIQRAADEGLELDLGLTVKAIGALVQTHQHEKAWEMVIAATDREEVKGQKVKQTKKSQAARSVKALPRNDLLLRIAASAVTHYKRQMSSSQPKVGEEEQELKTAHAAGDAKPSDQRKSPRRDWSGYVRNWAKRGIQVWIDHLTKNDRRLAHAEANAPITTSPAVLIQPRRLEPIQLANLLTCLNTASQMSLLLSRLALKPMHDDFVPAPVTSPGAITASTNGHQLPAPRQTTFESRNPAFIAARLAASHTYYLKRASRMIRDPRRHRAEMGDLMKAVAQMGEAAEMSLRRFEGWAHNRASWRGKPGAAAAEASVDAMIGDGTATEEDAIEEGMVVEWRAMGEVARGLVGRWERFLATGRSDVEGIVPFESEDASMMSAEELVSNDGFRKSKKKAWDSAGRPTDNAKKAESIGTGGGDKSTWMDKMYREEFYARGTFRVEAGLNPRPKDAGTRWKRVRLSKK
ncbi:hypothetical protein HK101_008943 [Irineochytrium annulatum]|nr:hypothetical protein HK101_008943 [Irineochytrium annulatum]